VKSVFYARHSQVVLINYFRHDIVAVSVLKMLQN